jgi:hypothetical protein
MKKLLITLVMAALISSSAMLSACGGNNQESATADTALNTTSAVEVEETTATTPTMSATDKAVTDAGLEVDKDGNIIDESGKKLKTDADGKVEITSKNGKKIKVDADEIKSANNIKSNTTNKSESNNSSQSSKAEKKNNTSSSSKAESSKPESSKSEPKPTQHTHSWKDITKATQVKVVDQKAYTYEEPVYEKQGRTICKVCGADITDNCTAHNKQHALNGEPVSYHDVWVEVQVGTKTVTVPEKSHYDNKTKVVGRKCSGCGKVEYY